MGTQRWTCLLGVCLCLAAGMESTAAAVDPDAGDEAGVAPGRAVVAVVDPDCDIIGDYLNLFAGTSRYRGNVYQIDHRAALKEIKMQLAFSGTTDLTVAIHCQQPDGTYKRFAPDVVIPGAVGLGANVPDWYTTGVIDPPVTLEPGSVCAIAFAWGSKSITYGRDSQSYPQPFEVGEVLGLVAAGPLAAPPDPLVPDTFPEFQIFTAGAYSMQLCFEPEVGACCSTLFPGSGCREVLETDCVGTGSFFHGEYTRCAETPCIFGACCTRCGQCFDGYTEESCFTEDGANHWPGVSCPAVSEDLCPPVTGACCRTNGACVEVCELLCDGVYQGDGTTCSPNPCKGACCIAGSDCRDRTPANCAAFAGQFRGLGTTCATLSGTAECGGACCFGDSVSGLTSCRTVPQRAACSYDAFDLTAYRGDGSTCPVSPQTCGAIDDYRACCLPDGTCINTTQAACTAVGVNGELNVDPSLLCEELPAGCTNVKACCLPEGDCAVVTDRGCTSRGGSRPANAPSSCGLSTCTTGACCFNSDDLCRELTQAACVASGGDFRGNGTTCAIPALVCPGIGACCRSDGGLCFPDKTCDECTIRGGECQGSGTVCNPPPCVDERGACCAITGKCLFITESQCHDIDPIPGVFRGIGVACAANTCPGACCLTGGCQARTPPANCLSSGGRFQGVDFDCVPDLCNIGACCNGDICSNQTQHTCERDGGAYLGDGVACSETVCALGACCQNVTCSQLRAPLCAQQDGVFLGEGVACAADTCPAGACCLATGCEVRTVLSCSNSAGVFQGVDVACEANLCVFGACCNGNTCSRQTRHTCERDGGAYLGDGAACDVDTCALGACCAGVVCGRDIRFTCEGGGHVFKGPGTTCDTPNACPCTNDAQCNDHNDCTLNDRCVSGVCVNDWHKGPAEVLLMLDCLDGPGQTARPECVCYDLDRDGDVDLHDVARFFVDFSAP